MHDFNEVYKYTKELTILYVEDDPAILLETKDILESFFLKVDIAKDGLEGIEKYKQYKNQDGSFYDIVLTDILMPKKDGIELIDDIYRFNKNQKIVVCSADYETKNLIKFIEMGIEGFLMKPINPEKLMKVLLQVSKAIGVENLQKVFLVEQFKLASMGKMVDAIAHQWLGPISILKMNTELLKYDNSDGKLSKEKINSFVEKNLEELEHLNQTLKVFRNFFKEDYVLEDITYSDLVHSVVVLLKELLIINKIKLDIDIRSKKTVKVIGDEFKHVVINIINNSIEAFNQSDQEIRKIKIYTVDEEDYCILKIEDNAGGISEDIINRIFQSNFTTKSKKSGTGVGLYLASQIINKIGGKIKADNVKSGVCFSIYLK